MYTDTEKPVILVATAKKQMVSLRALVQDIDPAAFMIVTDASEVRGEGFLKFTRDEL